MNAYELADYLDYKLEDVFPHHQDTIDMLRQLAKEKAELEKGLELVKDAYCARDSECRQLKDRIAELEKELAFMEGEYPEPTIAEKMKEFEEQSEPIGKVIYSPLEGYKAWWFDAKPKEGELLYTTPQTKPLSDEEIDEVFFKIFGMNPADKYALEFARAIEAKVREEK